MTKRANNFETVTKEPKNITERCHSFALVQSGAKRIMHRLKRLTFEDILGEASYKYTQPNSSLLPLLAQLNQRKTNQKTLRKMSSSHHQCFVF